MPKIKKFKCDILADFQTLCLVALVLNVTKVYFLQSQLQFPWNKSRNYQGSTEEDKEDILAGFYFFLLSGIIWTQKELFGKYRQPFW